jgi:transposase
VEILKQLLEGVCRKRPELWPNDGIIHHDSAPAHKALSVKQFLDQKLITEMEHPPCSHDLAPNEFWPFPKIKFHFKKQRFQHIEDIQKTCNNNTESDSTTGVPKNVSNSGSIIGLSI